MVPSSGGGNCPCPEGRPVSPPPCRSLYATEARAQLWANPQGTGLPLHASEAGRNGLTPGPHLVPGCATARPFSAPACTQPDQSHKGDVLTLGILEDHNNHHCHSDPGST